MRATKFGKLTVAKLTLLCVLVWSLNATSSFKGGWSINRPTKMTRLVKFKLIRPFR